MALLRSDMRVQKPTGCHLIRLIVAATFMFALAGGAGAQNLTLRVVCYNIEADTDGDTAPLPGLIYPASGSTSTTNGGVLEGIGEEILADGVAQPVDILALEETSGNTDTVAPIVAGLNAFYSVNNPLASNMYALAPPGYLTTGNGNGPNAMVYNTRTVQLLATVPVDPPGGTADLGSTSGEYREVMRYEFAPAGQTPTAATEFYVYVSHYKSSADDSESYDESQREKEAVIIRTNEATALPANARVLYVGDYNIGGSGEASYQTMLAADSPNGVAQGQGVDPLNLDDNTNIDWTADSNLSAKTEEDYSLHYRDDLQVVTTNVYNGAASGLVLVSSTYHAFGNNGTTGYEESVDDGADTALNSDLAPGSPISASQLYADLVGASDHLPVVADYTIPVNSPVAAFKSAPTNASLPPLTVTFTDASTGIVTNWSWNFGDSSISNTYTTTSVTHTYTNAGVYNVSETVSGPGGNNTVTQTNLVTVLTPYQAWQLQYFGCTTCPQAQLSADADGTGQDNNFKYVAGLNPTNPASVFTFSNAGMNLVFSPLVAGRSYTVLYSTNLLAPGWLPLSTGVTNVAGSQATVIDSDSGEPQKFYLIEISGP
jgi:PKD repeat protein